MKVIVRTPVAQRRITAENMDDLALKIKQSFKIENFSLFSDPERTIKFEQSKLEDNVIIYMSYEMEEPKIYKEENKCDHSPEAVCPKCATLDPLDRKRNDGIKVKYFSYRSYKEMLKENNKNEDHFDYRIKVCEEHPKNVKCMKCMEKTITLVPQVYRQIDYVEFDNKDCVESFIKKWRDSNRQRIGLLVGKYKEYDEYPLGLKTIVSGIWEIDQENFPDGAVINEIPSKFLCEDLEIVGLIYTDLFTRDGQMFSYKRDRNFIISNVELNFFYSIYKAINNPKMVGVCLTPNETNEIAAECFMITEQFVALMNAECLTMTTDCAYFETQREITYLIRNEYQKDVPIKANPFVPVDYFIVKCEVGYKDNPLFKNFTVIDKCNVRKLAGYFDQDYNIDKMSNFNILIYMSKYIKVDMLFLAVIKNDQRILEDVLKENEEFFQSMDKYCVRKWMCSACTFANEAYAGTCEMCGTPKIEN